MNRIEHVNLVSRDIDATLAFLQTAFPDWEVRGEGENEWYGKKRRWLHVGIDDYYITLNEGIGENNRDLKGHSPGLAHIGFSVDDVDDISTRLENKGYTITMNGPDHPYRKNVYFNEPSGFEFEFVQYDSDLPAERNLYDTETLIPS